MLRVSGPTARQAARSCWLTGADTSRDRPIGSPQPRIPVLPTLVDRAWDERIPLFVFGGDTLLGPKERLVRVRDWIRPTPEFEWDLAGETVARVRRRLAWERPRPSRRELWVVELFGDPLAQEPSPWPRETPDLIRSFLRRGEAGRSLVLALGRPGSSRGQPRGEALGVLAGFMAPGQTPAELELADVAPSVSALLGLGTPDGSLGVPRLDLLVPRDLPGAYVALQQGFPAALERHRAFHAALERPPPPLPDFGAAERHQKNQAWPEAVAAARAARELLRQSLQDQARRIRESWAREGRREDFATVYGLAVAGLLLVLVGLWVGWSRGGWGAIALAPCTGLPLGFWMFTWLESRPEGVWYALCQEPYQGLWMGAGVAMAFLAPVIPLTWRGRVRSGGALSVACLLAAVGLVLLAFHRYTYGGLDPWGLWPARVLVERVWLGGLLAATPLVALLLELPLAVVSWCERRPPGPSLAPGTAAPAADPTSLRPVVHAAPASPPTARRASGGT